MNKRPGVQSGTLSPFPKQPGAECYDRRTGYSLTGGQSKELSLRLRSEADRDLSKVK
jgi:hypothetical protein